ncbi:hypothetical protein ABID41_002098 [Phenylobacterium koreense]|uniref:Uncharacterized protein n=1 Tax=Phenylobacterium koreense TaxID=266125 RepID=A0ABV2EIX7_9CAUL
MTTCVTAARPPEGGNLAVEKSSRPLAVLRETLHAFARQGARSLEKVVKQYCVESEQRASTAMVRIAR